MPAEATVQDQRSAAYDRYRIPVSAERQIQGFTRAAMRRTAEAEVRRLRRVHGYGTRRVTITHPEVINAIDAAATERAASIRTVSNRMLKNALDGLPADAPQERIDKTVRAVVGGFREYNKGPLADFITGTAQGIGRSAFYTLSGIKGRWEARGSLTCEKCRAGIDDPHVSLPNHPHCFVAGTMVAGPSVHATFARSYEGPIVTIRTASGNKLSGTPNHPILTPEGWVPLGALVEGQDVFRCADVNQLVSQLMRPDEHQIPARIEDIGGTGAVAFGDVPGAPTHFHGDGRSDADVHVVLADRLFQHHRRSAVPLQEGSQPAGVRAGVALVTLDSQRPAFEVGGRLLPPPNSLVRLCGACGTPFRSASSGLDPVLLGSGADAHAGRLQAQPDGAPTNPSLLRQRLHRGPGVIAPDQVVHVERQHRATHVYNLSTSEGWYAANGIITSNCGCFRDFVTDGSLPSTAWDGGDAVDDEAEKAYNPNEPRGAGGRWTGGGSSSGGAAVAERPASHTIGPLHPHMRAPEDEPRSISDYVTAARDQVGAKRERVKGPADLWDKLTPIKDEQRAHAAKQLSDLTHGEVSHERVIEFLKQWSASPHNLESTAIQHASAIVHGLKITPGMQSHMQDYHTDPRWVTTLQEAFHLVQAQAKLTQDYYRQRGITHVDLYRGVKFANQDVPHQFRPVKQHEITDENWDTIRVEQQPLTSWSVSPYPGREFAVQWGERQNGYVLAARVPVEGIFANGITGFGAIREGEHLVHGGEADVAADAWKYGSFLHYETKGSVPPVNIDALPDNQNWIRILEQQGPPRERASEKAYNPNQPRGAHGRWTGGGSSGGAGDSTVRAIGQPKSYGQMSRVELSQARQSARFNYQYHSQHGNGERAALHRQQLEAIESEWEGRGFGPRQPIPTHTIASPPAAPERQAPTAPAPRPSAQHVSPALRQSLEAHLDALHAKASELVDPMLHGRVRRGSARIASTDAAPKMYAAVDRRLAQMGYNVREATHAQMVKMLGDGNASGFCSHQNRLVVLLNGLSQAERAHHLAHEAAHAHEPADEWSRNYQTDTMARAISQGRAESVAALVSAHFGVASDAWAQQYIAHWLAAMPKGVGHLDEHRAWILDTAASIIGDSP